MLAALKAGATPLRTAAQWLSVLPVSKFEPARNCESAATPIWFKLAATVQIPNSTGQHAGEPYLVKEDIEQPGLVEVLAAQQLPCQHRICDAHNVEDRKPDPPNLQIHGASWEALAAAQASNLTNDHAIVLPARTY